MARRPVYGRKGGPSAKRAMAARKGHGRRMGRAVSAGGHGYTGSQPRAQRRRKGMWFFT